MPELRRETADDFERWISSSPVPPDQRDAEDITKGIAAAIRCKDFKAVHGLMLALAFKDPERAQVIYDMIQLVAAGDERRAMLLAALHG